VKKFAAVLLAGGRSARMGTSKALLDHGGSPLWRFQMEKLIRLRPDQLFFSVRPEMEFPSGPWAIVHDRHPDSGPLGGLEAAMRLACADYLITLAVDMPAMTAEFLSLLLEKAGPAGIVPHLDGFYHGASAIYPVRMLTLVEQVCAGEDRSFQHLIREGLRSGMMKAHEVEGAATRLFENWNSPQDLKTPVDLSYPRSIKPLRS
jgi:molybdenum cofactor guanylyltransferase